MGRSSACLRIIACGRSSGNRSSNDADLRVSEVKSSKDKLGWSFRKKSARHRVLSDTVITERATYEHKEDTDESAIFSSQFIGSSNDFGNVCSTQCRDDKIQLVVLGKSLESEHASNADNGEEFVAESGENVHESAAVIVQAAIRGLLARRGLLKLKDVVEQQPEVHCNMVQKSFASLENTVEFDSAKDPQEREENEKLEYSPGVSLNFASEATEFEKESLVPSESEENLITYEGEKINFHPYRFTDSIANGGTEQASSEVYSLSNDPRTSNLDDTRLISGGLKFEQLGPIVNPMPTTFVGSPHHSSGASKTDDLSSKVGSAKEEKIVKYAVSDCGTELSISSTLDSPDRSEAGVTLDGLGKEVRDKGTEIYGDTRKHDAKAKDISTNLSTRLTEKHLESLDHPDEESDGSVVSIDVSQIEQKLKMNISDTEKELSFNEKAPSQEASARSQELLQTPSSQVSTKSMRSKPNKRSPRKNQKFMSPDKKSPSKPNHEQPPKDPANGKKRDSFGSDQERRNSTCGNSLPHFMQATESARAKLQANNGSPRSSPDVQERDIYVKKRPSLPGPNAKQVSPRIQQSRKERKWQR